MGRRGVGSPEWYDGPAVGLTASGADAWRQPGALCTEAGRGSTPVRVGGGEHKPELRRLLGLVEVHLERRRLLGSYRLRLRRAAVVALRRGPIHLPRWDGLVGGEWPRVADGGLGVRATIWGAVAWQCGYLELGARAARARLIVSARASVDASSSVVAHLEAKRADRRLEQCRRACMAHGQIVVHHQDTIS